VGAVDRELRLLAAVRSTRRSFGGKSSSAVFDQLLDERAAITRVNPARQPL
jgi:hypothetical protein